MEKMLNRIMKIIDFLKNKKKILLIIFCFLILAIFIIFLRNKISNNNKYYEILPQEEITEEQQRKTIVSLYFLETDNNELGVEYRLIDVKTLIKSPYETIINLLIEGPKNSKLTKLIPEDVKINSINLDGDNLIIDFSENFSQIYNNETIKNHTINSIEKTLIQLIEIDSIKITVNGI